MCQWTDLNEPLLTVTSSRNQLLEHNYFVLCITLFIVIITWTIFCIHIGVSEWWCFHVSSMHLFLCCVYVEFDIVPPQRSWEWFVRNVLLRSRGWFQSNASQRMVWAWVSLHGSQEHSPSCFQRHQRLFCILFILIFTVLVECFTSASALMRTLCYSTSVTTQRLRFV